MRVYLVGGAVRDELMGRAPHDFDWVVVGATPEMMLRLGFRQVGADFPVFLKPDTQEEYALARQERKVGKGYGGFETNFSPEITLEEDLSRRDLTINAIAKDLQTGEIIDPFGGRADLAAGVLRHVSDAFSEDPLRVLRLARFQAQTGFSIHPDTFELARGLCQRGELRELSFERVRVELLKLAAQPGAARGLESLASMGALDSLDPGWGKRLSSDHLQALDRACQSELPLIARAALLLGPLAPKDATGLLERLRFSQEEQRFCSRLMAARELLLDSAASPSPQTAVAVIEKAGLAKASAEQAAVMFDALALLLGQGAPAASLAQARAALAPYQGADLRQALALPAGAKKDGEEIGRRVAAARLAAVEAALSSVKTRSPKPF